MHYLQNIPYYLYIKWIEAITNISLYDLLIYNRNPHILNGESVY